MIYKPKVYYSLKKTGSIGHFFDLTVLEGLKEILLAVPESLISFPYSLPNSGTRLRMPAFDITFELLAGIIYSIVIIYIMNRSCQAVAKHSMREWGEVFDWILFEKLCGGGGVPFRTGSFMVGRGAILMKFILGLK